MCVPESEPGGVSGIGQMRYDAVRPASPASPNMSALFKRFLDLALMRLPPQAFPASRFLFGVVLAAFMLMAMLSNFLVTQDAGYSIARGILSALLLGAGAAVILLVTQRPARWLQTATALYGGEVVLIVFMLPILLAYLLDISNVFIVISQWLLILWEVVFIGHVYRNSLDTGMGAGVAIAFIYVIVSAVVEQSLIPFPEGAG